MWKMFLGVAAMLAGLMIMIFGRVAVGIMVLLVGLAVSAVGAMTMMGVGGYDPEQAVSNGMSGQGRRGFSAGKPRQSDHGEQSAHVWEQLEQKD